MILRRGRLRLAAPSVLSGIAVARRGGDDNPALWARS